MQVDQREVSAEDDHWKKVKRIVAYSVCIDSTLIEDNINVLNFSKKGKGMVFWMW